MTELTQADKSEGKKSGGGGVVRFILLLILGGALLAGFYYFTESVKKPPVEKKVDKAVPVTVATATTAVVPIEIRTIGNVLPFSVVNVIPQASGMLKKVCFTQGQFVKKGDALFQIDSSAYKASLDQAKGNVNKDSAGIDQAKAALDRDQAAVGQMQANLVKDQATQAMAKVESDRYLELLKTGAVSKEQSDQMNTNLAVAVATCASDQKQIENSKSVVEADRAAIQTAIGQKEADTASQQTASINLGWTTIYSPLDGKTGSLNVYEGNVVTAQSNTPLVSIAQVKPIYVSFTCPEQYLDQVRTALKSHTLKVQADIEGVKANAVMGDVSFLQNTVDTTTGTVVMRAAFDNDDHRLFPGQFVDVVVTIPTGGSTVVIPNTALQTTQQGTSVFVVNPIDNSVTLEPVEILRSTADSSAIGKGLKAGDVVVTDGQLQLAPGLKVKIVKSGGQTGGNGNSSGPGADPSGGSGASSSSSSGDGSSTGTGSSSSATSTDSSAGKGHHHHKKGADSGSGN